MSARSNKIAMHLFPHQSKAHLRLTPLPFPPQLHTLYANNSPECSFLYEWTGWDICCGIAVWSSVRRKSLVHCLYDGHCDRNMLLIFCKIPINKNKECFEQHLIDMHTRVSFTGQLHCAFRLNFFIYYVKRKYIGAIILPKSCDNKPINGCIKYSSAKNGQF